MDEQHAVLAAGTELGPYVIESRLGAGGMGEVYRARDKRLRRTVALKILPAHLAGTPGLRQRLEREAEVISSLNHPHICTLHDVGRQGEIDYLVMEFLEGETLAQRLKRGAQPVAELLEYAIQIAGALETAHSKGVIHRDIKPQNIFIVGRGQVKVLDFGLAKLEQPAPGPESATVTMAADLTSVGALVGTVAYMSPEQARGEEVDARTDLFSFGVVLYEMATGTAPFRGNSLTLILDAILHATPVPPCQLKPDVPAGLEQIINTALEKDRELRVQTAAEVRAALMRVKRDVAGQVFSPARGDRQAKTPAPPDLARRTVLTALAGAAAGAAAVGLFGIGRWRGAVPRNLTRFAITLPGEDFFVSSFGRRVAISPDGSRLAYVAVRGSQINSLRGHSLSELEAKPIYEGGAYPFFSPDGRWIGYSDMPRQQLKKIGISGGAAEPVCTPVAFSGATWADGDTIYFVGENPGGLLRVPAAGGKPVDAARLDFAKGERIHKCPQALPGGRAVLLTVGTADSESFDDAQIVAFSPATGQRKLLVQGGTHPRYSPSGHLLYARGGNILAIRLDPDHLAVMGQPFTVLEGVLMSRNTGIANFDLSASGDLAYIPGKSDGGARTLHWVDRDGRAEKLPLPPGSYLHPRISPDSTRLAIEIEGSNHDIYAYTFSNGVLTKMTTDGVSHWPVWSPDGKDIGYRSGPMGAFKLWQVPADRSRQPELVPATGVSQSAESYSPNGRALAYTVSGPGVTPNVFVVPLEGDRKPLPLDDTKYVKGSPKFSPDGRWVAYCSNESGKPQVYVRAWPGPGAKVQVSSEGGTDPVWKRSGDELYYRNGDSMMTAAVSMAGALSTGRPRELWKGHYSHGMSSSCGPAGATSSNYDVTSDGKRFLMIKDDDQDNATSKQIVVVQNWAGELNRIEKSKAGGRA